MFTRQSLLQLPVLLFCACEAKPSDVECGEDEYKTIDGSCAPDEDGGDRWDTGDTDGWWRDTGEWDTGGDVDVDVDVDDDWVEVEMVWQEDGLYLYAWGASDEWSFGMAELDLDSDWFGWTGEDCLEGDIDDAGTSWQLCHPVENDAEVWLAGVETPEEIVEGETTMMNSAMDEEDHVAYALWSEETGECYTWGAQSWYYESFAGCEEL